MEKRVASCPSQDLGFTNCIFLDANSFGLLGGEPTAALHLEVNGFVFSAKSHDKIEGGTVGMNSIQRRIVGASTNEPVMVNVVRDATMLSSATVEIDFIVKGKVRGVEQIDGAALSKSLMSRYENQFLTTGQLVAFDFLGNNFMFKVVSVEALDLGGEKGGGEQTLRGLLSSQTQLILTKAQGSPLTLTGLESQSRKTIFKADFNFSDMGIGGLDKEFQDIFRRAFASRIFPASVVKKLGVNHVKGMLLHGPPGTGKTLIARQIGKMLNGKEPKIVNGPEVSHHDEAVHSSPAARAACGWPRRNGRVLDACALRRRRSASCARTPSRLMRSALSRLMRSHPTPSPRRRWCTGALQVRWSE